MGYMAMRMKELPLYTTVGIKTANMILNEIKQTHTKKCHVSFYSPEVQKGAKRTYVLKSQDSGYSEGLPERLTTTFTFLYVY